MGFDPHPKSNGIVGADAYRIGGLGEEAKGTKGVKVGQENMGNDERERKRIGNVWVRHFVE